MMEGDREEGREREQERYGIRKVRGGIEGRESEREDGREGERGEKKGREREREWNRGRKRGMEGETSVVLSCHW